MKMTNKELEELIKSSKVEFFDANNITPSKDLDSYDYNLFLKFASQKELEEDSFTSETFKKIEEYKIQGLTPTVRFVEEDEEFYIDDKIRRNF
jgi:hypothetical protein